MPNLNVLQDMWLTDERFLSHSEEQKLIGLQIEYIKKLEEFLEISHEADKLFAVEPHELEELREENADLFNWRARVIEALGQDMDISAGRAVELIRDLKQHNDSSESPTEIHQENDKTDEVFYLDQLPKLVSKSCVFEQSADSCDDRDYQYLKVETEDAGAGVYLTLGTERWSLDITDDEEWKQFRNMLMSVAENVESV